MPRVLTNPSADAPGHAALTDYIGPYKVHNQLGVGGMGEVYRATTPDGIDVALKVIRQDLIGSDEVRRRFFREARAAARLIHTNIAQVYDFGSHQGRHYMVMELLDGATMAAWRHRPPDGATFLSVFHQILSALAYAHARGIVHRDLKPENIVLALDSASQPVAKVLDFGVAHFRDDNPLEYHKEMTLVGTPAYMAPEQALKASDVSPASDIYAVGVMLFELLTGKLPFIGKSAAGTMMAHLKQPVPELVLRPGYAFRGPLEQVLNVFLAKEPSRRYMFARDAIDALNQCELTGTPAASVAIGGDDQATLIPTLTGEPPRTGTVRGVPEDRFGLFNIQEAPFHGRGAQLDDLMEMAQRVLDTQQGGVVMVNGEMGMGKSRLIRHFQEQLEEAGLMQAWVGDYAAEHAAGHAMRSAVLRGLGMLGLTPAEIDLRISLMLRRHNAESDFERSALREFLTPEVCSDRCVLTSEAARFALIQRLLEREGSRRPVLLLIEDVHLSDGAPLRLAEWLLSNRAERAPWLLVLTYRPEQMPQTGPVAEVRERLAARAALDRVDTVPVGRMSPTAIRDLVTNWVKLPASLAGSLTHRADGNPFFAVELLRNLVESGTLEGLSDIPAEQVLEGMPLGLGALLRARIEEASRAPGVLPEVTSVWQMLAVLGLRFSYRLGIEMLRASGTADGERLMTAAIRAGIETNTLIEEDQNFFRFESGLLRDALMERAAERGELVALHRSAADCKVRFYFENLDPHAGEIARHYEAARLNTQAANYYLRAADYAYHTNLLGLALEAYGRVEAILAATRTEADELRIKTLIGQAKVHLQMANYDTASRFAIQARFIDSLAGEEGLPEATRIMATIAHRSGNIRQARVLYEVALSSAERVGDLALTAEAHFGLGLLDLGDGRLSDAERAFLTSRELHSVSNNRRGEASATAALGRVALAMGMYDEAKSLTKIARKLHEDTHNLQGSAECLLTIGEVHFHERRYDLATEDFELARADLLAIGARHTATVALMRLASAVCETREGDASERARALLLEALEDFVTMGDMANVSVARLLLAKLEIEETDWDQAIPQIEAALERDETERIDDPWFVESLVDIGRQATLIERTDLARRVLETAKMKLTRIASSSPVFDRTDEVEYILHELKSGESGEITGELDPDDSDPGESD